MSERSLAGVLREAPKPRSLRRARYFWPALVVSGVMAGAGIDQVVNDDRLAGGFLIFVGVWTMVAITWLDWTRA